MDFTSLLASFQNSSTSALLKTCLASVVCLVLYKVVTLIAYFRYLNKVYGDVQGPPNRHWLFGNLHELPRDYGFMERFLYLSKKYSRNGYFCLWFGSLYPVIIVDTPDSISRILKTSEPKPSGVTSSYRHSKDLMGDGLAVTNQRNKWMRMRRLLTPVFHFDALKTYVPVFNDATDVLMGKIDKCAENGDAFELFQHLGPAALEIIIRCACSYNIDPQRKGGKHPFTTATNNISKTLVYRGRTPYLHPDFIFYLTTTGRRMRRDCGYVHKVADEIIEKRRREMGEVGTPRKKYNDFLEILLTARDEDGVGLTAAEIRDEVDTFLFAGHHTTSATIAWTLYSLACHPGIQKKAQAEIDAILTGRESDAIAWSDLQETEYLTTCIKETMRFHGIVPLVLRETTKEIDLGDRVFPKSTTIMINNLALHLDEDLWEEPLKFIPERFSNENKSKMHPFQFIPFSGGPRNCIGQNFGMNAVKVVLARLLHRFTFELDATHVVRKTMQVVIEAENGLMMFAKHR